jgi:hypothetical protein
MARNPGYARYTEELIRGYLARPGLVANQKLILEWLEQPQRDPVWLRPTLLVFRICEDNPEIGEKISAHLIDWVMAGLRLAGPEQVEENNDQIIEQSSSPVD